MRSRYREGIKIEIKTHSRSEDEVQKILADCDLHNTIRQQEAHLHHDVAPEEGAADALRPYFLFYTPTAATTTHTCSHEPAVATAHDVYKFSAEAS